MLVLKLHRLGRISFRAVKNTRDYLRSRSSGSWLYLSRIAAAREYAALCTLSENGFPVPQPVACSRHTVLMERIDGLPLSKVSKVGDAAALFEELMDLTERLARCGIIHGDFNEFNIMLVEEMDNIDNEDRKSTEDGDVVINPGLDTIQASDAKNVHVKPILIDFPQIISTVHPNASEYFDRDVACLKRFFSSKLKYDVDSTGPVLTELLESAKPSTENNSSLRLDIVIEAAGFNLKKVQAMNQEQKAHEMCQMTSGGPPETASDVTISNQTQEMYLKDDKANDIFFNEVSHSANNTLSDAHDTMETENVAIQSDGGIAAAPVSHSSSILSLSPRQHSKSSAKMKTGWAI